MKDLIWKANIWFKMVVIFFTVSVFANDPVIARERFAGPDSTKVYADIESFSGKSGFTKFIFGLFFKPVASDAYGKKPYQKLIRKPYKSFEGKIIRRIEIVTLDPFGYSIDDTLVSSQNFLSKAGNILHIRTQPATIQNLLLFRQNQSFDSLRFKESERLVRSMEYITDVSFFVRPVSGNNDSIDVLIRVLDNWSLIPGGSFSASRITLDLKQNNFLGWGHRFQNGIIWNHHTGAFDYKAGYYIPNIRNTYINSKLQYGADKTGNFIKNIEIDRPFFSPLARWAAGVNFSQQLLRDSIFTSNFMQYKFNSQDYWAGNATRIFRGNSELSRTTNLISAARFLRIRYLEKPFATVDTLRFYSDEDFFLASLGISTRLYVQDRFIFRFGRIEDVPVGRVINLTGGYQRKNNYGRFYVGARFSSGVYYSWGYLGSNIEFGTFLHGSRSEWGVIDLGLNYFTGLIETGRWKFRQFIKPQITIGTNLLDYDRLTINNEYGFYGFNSPVLKGTSRILLAMQTQSYAPWRFVGFHVGPFLICSLGMLGNAENGFRSSRLYSQIGLGVLIKNENLVLSRFQLSIAYYPEIPGQGNNILMFNSFQASDFGFRDFEIGKPVPIEFR